MEELRAVFAANLIRLRTQAGMTQAELAAIIHYSDKSVSKWERAEGLPDVYILKQLAGIFGVSTDDLLSEGVTWTAPEDEPEKADFNRRAVTWVAFFGIWTLSVFLFVLFWMLMKKVFWIILLAAVPVSLILLLVFSCVWNRKRFSKWIVCGIVLAFFALAAFFLRDYHPWRLVFVLIPSEILVLLGYRIRIDNK